MTGAAFIAGAAAKVGTEAAKAATQDDPDVKRKMLELADDSTAMRSASEAFARRQEVWQRVRLRVLQPLAKFVGLSSDYFGGDFESDLQSRIEHIPEEHLRTPPTSIAVPAMIGLSYSLDDDSLKDMYLNLIARATDDRATQVAHPAFAELIKQLSPTEATVLLDFLSSPGPIVMPNEAFPPTITQPTLEDLTSFKRGATRSYSTHRRHLTPFIDSDSKKIVDRPETEMWIDNWVRLGLLEVDYDAFLNGHENYEWLDIHPEYLRLLADVEARGKKLDVRRGRFTPTAFGSAFREAVKPISPTVAGSALADS